MCVVIDLFVGATFKFCLIYNINAFLHSDLYTLLYIFGKLVILKMTSYLECSK